MPESWKYWDSLDRSSGSYEFDEFRIVEQDGRLYYGIDSGCSCPEPFETFGTLADWTQIENTPTSMAAFEQELLSWGKDSEGCSLGDREALIRKVKDHLEKIRA